MLIAETATVYRGPEPGCRRRFSRNAAYREWAKAIVRNASCRGGECYEGSGAPDDPGEMCERHDWYGGRRVVTRRLALFLAERGNE